MAFKILVGDLAKRILGVLFRRGDLAKTLLGAKAKSAPWSLLARSPPKNLKGIFPPGVHA